MTDTSTPREQIAALVARFAWLVDREAGVGVQELFTENGVYEMGAAKLEGRDVIARFYVQRHAGDRVSRHVFSNVTIESIEDGVAHARSLLTLFAADGPGPHEARPTLVADYDDELVWDDASGEWRFAIRRVTPVFGAPTLKNTVAGVS
jgi:hypothetical protein